MMLSWLFGKRATYAAAVAKKARPEEARVQRPEEARRKLDRVRRLEEAARRSIVEKHRAMLWREAEKAAKEGKYRLVLHENIWPHETDAMPELAKAMEADGFIVTITREDRMGDRPGNSGELYLIKYTITLDWRVGKGENDGK